MDDQSVVWVTIEAGILGKLKMPFIMFAGWDTAKRNKVASELKAVHAAWKLSEGISVQQEFICHTLDTLYNREGSVTKDTYDAIHYHFSLLEQQTKWSTLTNQIKFVNKVEGSWSGHMRGAYTGKELHSLIRDTWLKAQIGMLEVRTDFDFGVEACHA